MTFAHIQWDRRPVRIEYEWVGAAAGPVLVFLHEGLGSVSMWRDFPARLAEATGTRGLVYSRPGYGQSTMRPSHERWAPDFMHRQAREVLPMLLAALGVDAPVRLYGHSDGGSIALLHAAMFPQAVESVVAAAPHVFVEDLSISSIEAAKRSYESTDLRDKLARHHADPDSPFRGWNDIWLDPAFRDWNIERELEAIRCPLLALQGVQDEYGTLEQIRRIARRVPQARLLEIVRCGHSPHRDQPEAVIGAAVEFFGSR
jgi:pimeloyl-ACP methyl ester carboxylesterase